ncbi:MAG: PAS domain S-box protein [Clostridia bacterium]|nr:PAS domain S-box protein [Clostridia bacterium]MBP3627001.1 PAS domain S-box protein [Clostridia bacterium]
MSKKIFRSIIAVAMVVLLASLFISSTFLYDYFNKSQVSQLKEELSLVAANVDEAGAEYFDNFDSSMFRFTLVSADGEVLYDSQATAEDMENHLEREEIAEALKNGNGSSARYSSTLTERTFYEATRLQNGDILRISVSQVTVGALMLSMLPAIVAIILISAVVALVLSHKMAKDIVKPLNELDLENPAENETYEELAPILTKLNKQHKQITRQMQELRQKSDEFEQITASMNEGLVLLDKKGMVLSINSAAKKLFSADETAVGRDFLTLDRSTEMSRAIEKALDGKRAEFREERNGSEYNFIISRIESDGKTVGVVILCFDVTETAFAERNRKEFTANVSHELKTPLQSIIGSAELLENGLVKPEDTKRFVGNIKNEATRLVSLINDIIRLSQLDENSEPATESVDLYDVANEVIEVLTVSAAKKQVELNLNGESCVMNGIRRYLYEIVYNLCDNAIRYNKDGGKVTIDLKNKDGNIILSVSDTGIGIPAEHHSRIFERFYRVDKSHSKETGGTGLGLSIVKHAVSYHGGTIKLDSKIGEGTTITIIF